MRNYRMAYQECCKYFSGKLAGWQSTNGDLSEYVVTSKDEIRSELAEDNAFRETICQLVRNIAEKDQTNYLFSIIRKAGTLPRVPSSSAAIDVLIAIILDICGYEEEARSFLLGSLLVILGM